MLDVYCKKLDQVCPPCSVTSQRATTTGALQWCAALISYVNMPNLKSLQNFKDSSVCIYQSYELNILIKGTNQISMTFFVFC